MFQDCLNGVGVKVYGTPQVDSEGRCQDDGVERKAKKREQTHDMYVKCMHEERLNWNVEGGASTKGAPSRGGIWMQV